jgi:hypothetical protein
VSTIDPRASVLAALQSRLASLRPSRPRASAGKSRAVRTQAVASAVAQRVACIDRSDPDRRRKAVRVVLEVELARTFGGAVLNDPAFPGMLDAVQEQMQADAQTAAAVHALGELLLAGPQD